MSIEKPYQPSIEEIKKAKEVSDAIQNKRGEEIMTERQKERSEDRDALLDITGKRKDQELDNYSDYSDYNVAESGSFDSNEINKSFIEKELEKLDVKKGDIINVGAAGSGLWTKYIWDDGHESRSGGGGFYFPGHFQEVTDEYIVLRHDTNTEYIPLKYIQKLLVSERI